MARMRRWGLTPGSALGLTPVVTVLLAAVMIAALPAATVSTNALDAARDAWARGDYVAALNGFVQLLSGPGADRFVEPIARETGELYETRELTTDGRAPRFSPDDQYIVYETGLEVSRRTRILRNDKARALVADLPGVSLTFSTTTPEVAYLRIPDSDEIRRASDALARASLTAANRGQLTQQLAWLVAKQSTIVTRDLSNGREMELPTGDLAKTGLVYSADGRSLFFLGADERDPNRTDIYTISDRAPRPSLVVDAVGLKSAPIVDPTGATLVYVVATQNPLRPPTGQGGRGGQGGREGAPAAATPPRQPANFVIVDLATKRFDVVAGTVPSLSGDGKTIAYVQRTGEQYSIMVGPTRGAHAAVKKTFDRLDAPALSPDGSRVAYQDMLRDDWEIFVASCDAQSDQRLTRDIQHDLLPHFIGPNRLLAVVGEPRHRRSFLYDLDTGVRTRLFHNNTVRTIAPEYQWSVSADGTKLLIGAERDGDTVSPERGVYLVDLQQKVTRAEVLARLREDLRTELALKETAARLFQPMADAIRPIVARESPARIYEYEKALVDFDSRHISRPGNRKASSYLYDTFKSLGYEPEYQWFEPRGALGGKSANVIAALRGTANPELVYVVSSHYDSVAGGPGADDDASGVAALLEAARVLRDHPMPATIVFAAFTGEEAGLLGSKEFVRRAVESKTRIVGALNNDMVGWMNDERMDLTIRYSNAGIRDIQHGAALLFTKLITYDSHYFKGTDAVSYYDAFGDIVGGIGSYPVLSSPHYHQPTDLLENESFQLIAEASRTTTASLMLMASSPAPVAHLAIDRVENGTATVSWTPSPEHGVASYTVAYGPRSNPLLHRTTVSAAHAVVPAPPGTVIAVRAVNARGLAGWDWSRVVVGNQKLKT